MYADVSSCSSSVLTVAEILRITACRKQQPHLEGRMYADVSSCSASVLTVAEILRITACRKQHPSPVAQPDHRSVRSD